MGFGDEIAGSPVLFKAGLGVSVLGLIIDIVGVATDYWFVVDNGIVQGHGGLFPDCLRGHECKPSWLVASEALVISGLLLWFFALCVAVVGRGTQNAQQVKAAPLALIIACFIGLIGTIVAAAENPLDVGWSMILCFVSCALGIGSAVCLFLGNQQGS